MLYLWYNCVAIGETQEVGSAYTLKEKKYTNKQLSEGNRPPKETTVTKKDKSLTVRTGREHA